jgi:hypothetical protein
MAALEAMRLYVKHLDEEQARRGPGAIGWSRHAGEGERGEGPAPRQRRASAARRALQRLTRPGPPPPTPRRRAQPEWWARLPAGWEAAAAGGPVGGVGVGGARGVSASVGDVLQEGAWVVIQQVRRAGAGRKWAPFVSRIHGGCALWSVEASQPPRGMRVAAARPRPAAPPAH